MRVRFLSSKEGLTNRYEETGGQVDDQGGKEESVRHANQRLQHENVESVEVARRAKRVD